MNYSRGSVQQSETFQSKLEDYSDDEDCCELEKGCVKLRKCCYCVSLRIGALIVALLTVCLCITILTLHGVALNWITSNEKQHLAAGRSPDPYIGVKVMMSLGIVLFFLWIILSGLMALAVHKNRQRVLMYWVYYSMVVKVFCFSFSLYCVSVHDQFFESGYNTACFVHWLLMIPFWVYCDFVVFSLDQEMESAKEHPLDLTSGGEAAESHDWSEFKQQFAQRETWEAGARAVSPRQEDSRNFYDANDSKHEERMYDSRREVNQPEQLSLRLRDSALLRGDRTPRGSDMQSMRSEQSLGDSLNLANVLIRGMDKSRTRVGQSSTERSNPRDRRQLKRMSGFDKDTEESLNESEEVDSRTRGMEAEHRPREEQRPVPTKRRSLSQDRGRSGSRHGEATTNDHVSEPASRQSVHSPPVHYAESNVYSSN